MQLFMLKIIKTPLSNNFFLRVLKDLILTHGCPFHHISAACLQVTNHSFDIKKVYHRLKSLKSRFVTMRHIFSAFKMFFFLTKTFSGKL